MSVEQEAVAAARAAYPDTDAVSMVVEGKPIGVLVAGNPVHAMARTPYAQGYQAGRQRGGIERTREVIEFIQERFPSLAVEIDLVFADRHPDEIALIEDEIRGRS